MQKVSFSFPPEFIDQLDRERGNLSRNKFVLGLLEKALHRITAEVYSDENFALEEEELAEDYAKVAQEPEQ